MALSAEQAADRSIKIEVLRRRAGYSINQLAEAMGLSGGSSIQRYLATDYSAEFRIEVTRGLCAALLGKGVPPISESDLSFLGWSPTPLALRILARLTELEKNPSSVALEGGLGRSSVRDIIINNQNPRIDTLQKLTGPLECTLEYLTGTSAVAASQWDGAPTPQQIIRALAAGGFKIVEFGDDTGQSEEIQMSGAEIRAASERLGWSHDDLAERSGSTQQTVDRIEKDQTEFSRARPAIIKALKDNRIDATDDPRGFVQEIISRRNIKPTTLAKQVGLAVSTLNRFLKGDNPTALLSTRTLQKIKEWDAVQGVVPDAIGNPTGFVLEIMARRDLSPSALAVGAGVNPSTLTRALNDPDHKFQLSTTTLQKINEWDRAQTFGAKCGVPT